MSLHYTLETMDQTVLCRCFNYHSFPPLARLWLKFWRQISNKRDHYTLGDVYRMFMDGKTVQEIRDDNSDLTIRAALIGRCFYMIHNVSRAAWQSPKRYLKTMIDENIDIDHSVEGGIQALGPTTHVAFEGLVGQKDLRLWGRLRAQGHDLLITKDRAVKTSRNTPETRDITRCAIMAWQRRLRVNGGVVDDHIRSLPVIVHVPHDASPSQIKNMLRAHRNSIFDIHDERVSPVINLTKGKAKPGIHFFEILGGDLKHQIAALRNKRVDVLCDRLNIGTVTDPKREKEIRASLKRAVEHEISQELKPLSDHNAKVEYLFRGALAFYPDAYEFSGNSQYYLRVVEKSKIPDPMSLPLQERLRRRKELPHLIPQAV